MISIKAEGIGKDYQIRSTAPGGSRYVTKVALESIDLEVAEGEVFGIIGRNGSGKSTLLKILSRIVTPTRGHATILGTIAALLEVGTGMHPEMTGRENIFLNGALLGMAKRDIVSKFDQIVDFAGVAEYIDTPIKRYSSGMRLRLAFAVAAFLSADVMIIDEVLAVGDAEFQARCLGAMRDSVRSGRTVLFVSHNMPAVESLCTRVGWLDKGVLARVGEPSDVIREYLETSFVSHDGAVVIDDATAPAGSEVQLSKIVVSGANGANIQQGDDVDVDVRFRVHAPVRGLKLLFKVTTLEDYPVFAVSSIDYGIEWNLDPGAYRAFIALTSVRLLPRSHKVSVYLYTQWDNEIVASAVEALHFDVVERDVLGTGRPIRADRGVTWVPAEFRLETSAQDDAIEGRLLRTSE